MCDIGHEESTVFVCGFTQRAIVPVPWVRRRTADNETGLEDTRLLSETAIVDELRCGVETVREGLEVDR